MKLKNVKVGTRVMLKEDKSTFTGKLKKGATGTIMEDFDYIPRVRWDNFTEGTKGLYATMSDSTDICAVSIRKLKRIK